MQEPESHDILNTYELCKEMHCLPEPGGLNNQDAVLVHLFKIILQLTREKESQQQRRSG